MSTQFDEQLSDAGLSRAKWDMEIARTGDRGILCFGTADMDFRSPPAVVEALAAAVSRGHFGYPFKPDSYYTAIGDHYARRTRWEVQREWLRSGVGIYASLHTLIDELTEPGDEIVFQTPVHHIFREIIEANGRVPIENPLLPVDGRYRMDLDTLVGQVGPRTRMFLLCNPHNPVGRAWTRDELAALSAFCAERGILVVADEVYYALLHDGVTFTPFASLSLEAAMQTVTVTSASKSFNLTGLKHSLVIAANLGLLEAYDRGQRKNNSYFGGSSLGILATEAAMTHGDPWINELMTHIAGNRARLRDWLHQHAPEISMYEADATYFAWLDFRAWDRPDAELMRWFETQARIVLTSGAALGTGGAGHVRWNLACSETTLNAGLDRLADALPR